MDDAVLVRVACPDMDTAKSIARAAVKARLAACANISSIESVYRWQDAVEEDPEVLVELKTVRGRAPALAALIRDIHSYDLPAITWHTIEPDAETAAWLKETTAD